MKSGPDELKTPYTVSPLSTEVLGMDEWKTSECVCVCARGCVDTR